jgi:deazaflavin-dependent oxidoreductase (nitroreductase family)
MEREPFAANLHFIPRALRAPQNAVVRVFRRYFESAPGWVLLTTTGRKTGLRREVLLPCERYSDGLIVISTYGWRSNWIRNISHQPEVRVTCGGWVLSGRAEIVVDPQRKLALISANPFFPAAPFVIVHAVLRTLLRPLLVLLLRRWVAPRPIVLIRPRNLISPTAAAAAAAPAAAGSSADS